MTRRALSKSQKVLAALVFLCLSLAQTKAQGRSILIGKPVSSKTQAPQPQSLLEAKRLYLTLATAHPSGNLGDSYFYLVAHSADGKPAGGALVFLGDVAVGTTNSQGVLVARPPPQAYETSQENLLLRAIFRQRGETHVGDIPWPLGAPAETTEHGPQGPLSFYLNHRIFRPGETVEMKTLSAKNVALETHFLDPQKNLLASGSLQSDGAGESSFRWPLPQEMPEGVYTLVLQQGPRRSTKAIRIQRCALHDNLEANVAKNGDLGSTSFDLKLRERKEKKIPQNPQNPLKITIDSSWVYAESTIPVQITLADGWVAYPQQVHLFVVRADGALSFGQVLPTSARQGAVQAKGKLYFPSSGKAIVHAMAWVLDETSASDTSARPRLVTAYKQLDIIPTSALTVEAKVKESTSTRNPIPGLEVLVLDYRGRRRRAEITVIGYPPGFERPPVHDHGPGDNPSGLVPLVFETQDANGEPLVPVAVVQKNWGAARQDLLSYGDDIVFDPWPFAQKAFGMTAQGTNEQTLPTKSPAALRTPVERQSHAADVPTWERFTGHHHGGLWRREQRASAGKTVIALDTHTEPTLVPGSALLVRAADGQGGFGQKLTLLATPSPLPPTPKTDDHASTKPQAGDSTFGVAVGAATVAKGAPWALKIPKAQAGDQIRVRVFYEGVSAAFPLWFTFAAGPQEEGFAGDTSALAMALAIQLNNHDLLTPDMQVAIRDRVTADTLRIGLLAKDAQKVSAEAAAKALRGLVAARGLAFPIGDAQLQPWAHRLLDALAKGEQSDISPAKRAWMFRVLAEAGFGALAEGRQDALGKLAQEILSLVSYSDNPLLIAHAGLGLKAYYETYDGKPVSTRLARRLWRRLLETQMDGHWQVPGEKASARDHLHASSAALALAAYLDPTQLQALWEGAAPKIYSYLRQDPARWDESALAWVSLMPSLPLGFAESRSYELGLAFGKNKKSFRVDPRRLVTNDPLAGWLLVELGKVSTEPSLEQELRISYNGRAAPWVIVETIEKNDAGPNRQSN